MAPSATTEPEILRDRRDDVMWITFNRPHALNAMTHGMEAELIRIFREINDDPEVRVLVLTGMPGRKPAFMAGADMGYLDDVGTPEDAMQTERVSEDLMMALEQVRKPTVAAISGACVGMGTLIASACDVRVVSRSLRFGFPIAQTVGNCLSAVNFARLVAMVGVARTKEMIFSARLFDAQELNAAGAVREVVEDEDAFNDRVQQIASELAQLAPLTLWGTKETLRRMRDAALEGAEKDDLLMACYQSVDYHTAISSFVSKTKPVFKGR